MKFREIGMNTISFSLFGTQPKLNMICIFNLDYMPTGQRFFNISRQLWWVFRTQEKIYDVDSCLKAVNYFRKKLHHKYLTGS